LLPENKIIRVSIIPTSKGAGGYTLSTPNSEEVMTKRKIINHLSVLMAGEHLKKYFSEMKILPPEHKMILKK
jgi:cell division protease FtsH